MSIAEKQSCKRPVSMVTSFLLTDTFNTETQQGNNWACRFGSRYILSFAIMSVFEQLQPFVSLCQACGFVPYTIKRNSTSGKFERFTFSFKNVITWWFLLVLAYQIFGVSTVGYLSGDIQDILSTDRTIPTTLIILTGISSSLFLAQLLPSRWIALHHRHLTNAVEAIQRVERLFGEEFITEHASSIPIRFVIGFAAVLMTVKPSFFQISTLF